MARVVYLDGAFVDAEEAKISLFDRGYLVGMGVFATMRAYGGACFRPDPHLRDLERGCRLLGLDFPTPRARLEELADEAARRCGAEATRVRVTLTAQHESTLSEPLSPATTSIVAEPMLLPSEEAYARGIEVVLVSPRRIPPSCLDGSLKTTSYAVQVLARREATLRGAGEGLQLALDGCLAGGTMSNLFLVEGNDLVTPSLATGCRAGVTREAILALGASMGLDVHEELIAPARLKTADEVFLTSTRVEVLGARSVDGYAVGNGRYPVTGTLRAAFRRLAIEETVKRILPV